MAYQNSTTVAARLSAFLHRMQILNPAETSEIGADQIQMLKDILHDLDPTVRLDNQQITQWLLATLNSAQTLIMEQANTPPSGESDFEWTPSNLDGPLASYGLFAYNGTKHAEYFPGLTSFTGNMPELGDGITMFYGDDLTSISFPNLAQLNITSGLIFIQALPALTEAHFPSLVRWKKKNPAGSIICGIKDCPGLNVLELSPSFTVDVPDAGNNEVYDFSGNDLPQATVDFILVRAAATMTTVLVGANLSIFLDAGTNASPSAAGLAAKATLVARNVTVTNN